MKTKSIFKQLLVPMIAIVTALAVVLASVIIAVFTKSYEKHIYTSNQEKTNLMSGEITAFMDGAFGITEELSVNPSILTMNTQTQTPILEDCVARNPYLELLYIQGMDGMQTGRSSGALADRSTRWWFIQTMEEKKSFVSKSYYSVNTGMPCASIFFPMYKNGNMIGIFAVDLKLDYLQSIMEEFSSDDEGTISFVIDGEGIVVAHPDSTQIEELYNYKMLTKTVSQKDEDGTPLTDADGNILTQEEAISVSDEFSAIIADVMAGNSGSTKIHNDGQTYYASYTTIPLKGDSDSWSIITLQKESAAMAMVNHMILIAVLVALAAIGVAILVIALLARKLTRPVVSITNLMKDASDGDFSVQADESSGNELGLLSRSFNKMAAKISGIMTKMTTFIKAVVQSSGYMKDIETNIYSINESAKEISRGTQEQVKDAAYVVERADELEERFRQLKEKSGVLLQNARNTIISSENGVQSIDELKAQNELTAKLMEESNQRILTLEEQSQNIARILDTINDIASQTTLLSLNASIEAARAGEQGRGFAIVADSIGKLASDSTASTTDIGVIIEKLCQDVEEAVTNIEKIRGDINGQFEVVDKVQDTFSDFKELAEKTQASVYDMEALVDEMYELNRSMVNAAGHICSISENTTTLFDKMGNEIEKQLQDIHVVSESIDNLSKVSTEMEQEMTKFKL